MRIAYVCSYYPWPPSFGGVETIVRTVATKLAEKGYEIYVVSTPFDVTTGKQVSNYGVEEKDGITIFKLRPGKIRIGYARFIKGLRKSIEKIDPDIVHAHNLHPHLFQLALWKNNFRYKLVAELHYPAVELDFLVQKFTMPFALLGLKNVSKKIDAFVAHTEIEKYWLESIGIASDKIAIIRFPAIPSELLNYKTNIDIIGDVLYLGRIVPRKGVHMLIKALSIVKQRIHDIKATIAGPADLQYLDQLKRLVKELDLENNLTFLGPVEEGKKYQVIKSHKILVIPSLKDYTPSVPLEAQALGVPVIASRVGAIPEIVKDKETGILVEPGNVLELAKAIEILLTDNDLYHRYSRYAATFVSNFTLEKALALLEALYSNILTTTSV
ncbi:MAG: glycosyltransferase family 4 protein [Desulfurococcaceae archaeon]|nr:glycosyltransferase family 4 protein [Desulfurococcaceae archaeon]